MMQIKDLAAMVTGGGSGLGAATAAHLATLGCKVAVVDINKAAAEAQAAAIGGIGVGCDVADAAGMLGEVVQLGGDAVWRGDPGSGDDRDGLGRIGRGAARASGGRLGADPGRGDLRGVGDAGPGLRGGNLALGKFHAEFH